MPGLPGATLFPYTTLFRSSKEIAESYELAGLAEQEGDKKVQQELKKKYQTISRQFKKYETEALLAGKYDSEDAIMIIHSGTGGVEAQDWAEMLMRMYLRYAENRGFKTQIIEKSEGEEAGIKSVSMEFSGNNAYGYLRSEAGIHRLVRISPFDADKQRHTSFALVEVIPSIEDREEVKLDERDLEIATFRASGQIGRAHV